MNQTRRISLSSLSVVLFLCIPIVTVSAAEIIVDNSDGGFSVVSGSWSTGTSATDKYGSDYRFNTTGSGADEVKWEGTISTADTYSVYCWYPQGTNRATDAAYTVYYDGGSQTIDVNQQNNGGQWNLLGSFSFATGTCKVELSDDGIDGSKVVMADAVRWLSSGGPTNTPTNTPTYTPEARAVWVDVYALDSIAKIQAAIDKAVEYNMNCIIPEVRCRGDAYYFPNKTDSTYSNPEPRSERLDTQPTLDVLQEFITRGHAEGLKVIAWVTTNVCWSSTTDPDDPDHIFNDNYSWITEKQNGSTMSVTEAEGAYVDPGRLDVQAHLLNVFKDIITNYPDIDGFQLDYIRYPGTSYDRSTDYGFDPVAKQRFYDQFGKWPSPTDSDWQQWKRDQVTAIVEGIWDWILANEPDVDLSCAVFGNRNDAYGWKFQDWKSWALEPILDLVCTMSYSETTSTVTTQAADAFSNTGSRNVAVGLKAWANSSYPTSQLVAKVNAVRDLSGFEEGKDGFAFFDSDGLRENTDAFYKGLVNDPLSHWAPWPPRPSRPSGPTNTPTNTPTSSGPPADVIVDNSDSGFSVVSGSWTTSSYSSDRYGADYCYNTAAYGADVVKWEANITQTGSYYVYCYYPQGSNRCVDSPYKIYHSSGSTTVDVNQQSNGGQWNLLGTFSLNSGTNKVELSDDADPDGNVVMADAIKWAWAGSGPTNTPTNTPSDTPTNTPTNTPTSAATPVERIVDDGDSGFTTSGSWSYVSSGGSEPLNGDYYWTSTTTGASTKYSDWEPDLTAAGNYKVYVRYRDGSNRAYDAPYTVYYNGGSQTVDVDQRYNGGSWVLLGTYNFAAGTSGYVRLNNGPAQGSKVVIADAVKFTPE